MSEEIKETVEQDEAAVQPEAQAEAANEAPKEKEGKKKVRALEAELREKEKELEAKAAELAELNDKYLRLAAEYDNFRRRSAKERDNIYGDAFEEALSAFLPVVDNLERAARYADGESVAKGVEMVLRSVSDTMARLGITEIEAEGKEFDPQLHTAVMHVEDEQYGESEVVEVLQKGYTRGDRVLRYAMVKVAN